MITARIYVPQKDSFTVFPKTLESALKMLKQTESNIKSRFKVANSEFITFNETRDFITIKD